MSRIFSNTKGHAKKVAIFGSLFLLVFFVTIYVANLDLSPKKEGSILTDDSGELLAISDELKKKLGSTSFSFSSFSGWEDGYGVPADLRGIDKDADGDGLLNYLEYFHGTDPMNMDTDGDGFSDQKEILNGYDPDASGDAKPRVFVKINKLGVDAPMVWSASNEEESMLKDLENGIIHFPKTAAPGQDGNVVLSGHSSNYIWAKGNYNHIFKSLNDLEKGDVVMLKVIQRNGRVFVYSYEVKDKFITSPDDERIFAESVTPDLTLSTCWPIGTNLKRIIVKAELLK